jgi:hypothetical protein
MQHALGPDMIDHFSDVPPVRHKLFQSTANTESRYGGQKRIPARGIVSLSGLVTSPPVPRHPRIRLSTLGESGKSSWKGRRRLLRRGLAAPCSGRGNWPPKAVSEPPAGAKCKPFRFVSGHSTRKYQISLCTQIFIGTRCFPCTTKEHSRKARW